MAAHKSTCLAAHAFAFSCPWALIRHKSACSKACRHWSLAWLLVTLTGLLDVLCSITPDSYPAKAGDYSTWVPPYSYASMAQMEERVGYVVNGTCLRNATLKELLVCPPGQESLPAEELATHCDRLNISCPQVRLLPPCFQSLQPTAPCILLAGYRLPSASLLQLV